MNSDISLQNIAHFIIVVLGIGYLMFLGSTLIQPIVFSILIAIFLLPLDRFFLSKVKLKWLSISLSFIVVMIPCFLVFYLLSSQLINITDSLPSMGENLKTGFDKVLKSINKALPFFELNSDKLLSENANKLLDGPLNVLGKGLVTSSEVIVGFGLTFIYTCFMLYYRNSFMNFIVFQFEKKNRKDIKGALSKVKTTVQAYVGGLGIVILILSIVNSIGLLIIGVEYAMFWGILGGLLAIIPFVGTGLGALLPFLYSLATAQNYWQPIAIVLFFMTIQQIEGNFITPKIVGSKVNINPLFSILALLFFGSLWGIGGVILALPIISIIRIVFLHFESTLPFAILMGSEIADNSSKFKEIADSI
jgi:predicted PurR-regulated permease PerM